MKQKLILLCDSIHEHKMVNHAHFSLCKKPLKPSLFMLVIYINMIIIQKAMETTSKCLDGKIDKQNTCKIYI